MNCVELFTWCTSIRLLAAARQDQGHQSIGRCCDAANSVISRSLYHSSHPLPIHPESMVQWSCTSVWNLKSHLRRKLQDGALRFNSLLLPFSFFWGGGVFWIDAGGSFKCSAQLFAYVLSVALASADPGCLRTIGSLVGIVPGVHFVSLVSDTRIFFLFPCVLLSALSLCFLCPIYLTSLIYCAGKSGHQIYRIWQFLTSSENQKALSRAYLPT